MPGIPHTLHDPAQLIQPALCVLRLENSNPISFENQMPTLLKASELALETALDAPEAPRLASAGHFAERIR